MGARRKLVYVAGPYTQGDVEANVAEAIRVGNVLIDKGYAPIVPHLSHYQHMAKPQDYETWMEIDFSLIEVCDLLLRIPGDSPGADREVDLAIGIDVPVVYAVEDLDRDWKPLPSCAECGLQTYPLTVTNLMTDGVLKHAGPLCLPCKEKIVGA